MEKTENELLTLAVETSSRIGSVGLALGEGFLEESVFSSPMQHSAEVFPAIQGLLARHGRSPKDLNQIHIAVGPGSFTGLRIAVSLAKAMHLAQKVRIVTVDSLDVVVANLSDGQFGTAAHPGEPRPSPLPDRVVALFDAKRGQFYAAVYEQVPQGAHTSENPTEEAPGYEIPAVDGRVWRKVHPDSIRTTQEIADRFIKIGFLGVLGDGLLYHREEFMREGFVILPEQHWSPRASNVFRLGRQKAAAGRFADPLALTPFYLRGPQVTLKTRT